MLLHNQLDIIGRNEPIQRKARFWQSYVRALKGTDDMRAPESSRYYPSRGIFRPLLSDFPTWPGTKSMYDDPIHASDRISVPGYRYMPISRETYGISPRNIYPHHYSSLDRYPRHADAKTYSDWDPTTGRAEARPHVPYYREYSPGPDGKKIPSIGDRLWRGGYRRPALSTWMDPSPWIPISRFTRDPWWYAYPQYRPFRAAYIPMSYSPFYLRDSYLSPVKRTYLWRDHPIRPFMY